MRRTLLPAVLLASLALVLAAGCGGDKSDNAAETQATITEPVTTEAIETTETEAVETEETDTEATETTETVADTDISGLSEECDDLVNIAANFVNAFSGQNLDDTEEAKRFLDEFADKAPDEIRDDFRVVADAYAKLVDALKGVDLSSGDPEALKKLQEISSQIDQQKLQQANDNISAWVEKNCS